MDNTKNKKMPQEQRLIYAALEPTDDGNSEMKITPFVKTQPQPLKSYGEAYVFVDDNDQPLDAPISVSKQKVRLLIDEGKMDQTKGQLIIELFDEHEKQVKFKKESASQNKNTANQQQEDHLKTSAEKATKQLDAMKHLIAIKESIKNELSADKIDALFKKNVNTETCFGITKALMDRLNYLPELLRNAELILPQDGSSTYKITSILSSESESGIGPIGLEHTLLYNKNAESVEDAFRKYLEDMEDALKVFLAYWAFANAQEAFCYEANIIDIMATMSMAERKSYFTVKEKVRFWALSKLLEKTYLTLSFKHGKQWIKVSHPFLNLSVTASSKENQENNEGYPNKTIARVLNPDDFQKKANLATEVSKGTLKLPTKDIMLALTFQTRVSQRRAEDTSSYDEKFLIDRAGLLKTQASNPRMARKRLAEKIDRIEKAEGIGGWQKSTGGKYIIKRRKQKKLPLSPISKI